LRGRFHSIGNHPNGHTHAVSSSARSSDPRQLLPTVSSIQKLPEYHEYTDNQSEARRSTLEVQNGISHSAQQMAKSDLHTGQGNGRYAYAKQVNRSTGKQTVVRRSLAPLSQNFKSSQMKTIPIYEEYEDNFTLTRADHRHAVARNQSFDSIRSLEEMSSINTNMDSSRLLKGVSG
jgi:hypothetical protein